MASEIWVEQLEQVYQSYKQLVEIASRLRMPHNGVMECTSDCFRCAGERMYDDFLRRSR